MPKLSQRQIEMSQSLRAGMQPGAPYPKAKLKPETEPNVETKSGRRPLCTFIVAKQSKEQRQVLLYDFFFQKGKDISLQKHQSLTFHLTGVCVNAETEISTSEMSSS